MGNVTLSRSLQYFNFTGNVTLGRSLYNILILREM